MILGLSGRRSNGKDTFANILIKANPLFSRLSFADKLKRICMEVFHLSLEQVTDHLAKERPFFPGPIAIDDKLEVLRKITGLDLKPLGLVAQTPREVLRYVGTDYIRNTQPEYWLDAVVEHVEKNKDQNFVITDVRFENEARVIHELEGRVIRMLRLSAKNNAGVAEHESEKMDFVPDFVLAVLENNFSLLEYVARRSIHGKVELHALLGLCDWRYNDANVCNDVDVDFIKTYYSLSV